MPVLASLLTSKRWAMLCGVALALGALPVLVGAATADSRYTITPTSLQNCNGVRDNSGSDNTRKTLVDADLGPGGEATFQISYPYDPAAVNGEFRITDCFENATTGKIIQSLDISFVPNNADFSFQYTLPLPADVPIGTKVCNYAKTTSTPTAAQGSNRKAAAACFVVGGTLRVVKKDSQTGLAAPGGRFTVACTPSVPSPRVVISGLDETTGGGNTVTGVLNGDAAIEVAGPVGAPCTVTELVPPPGYVLPAQPVSMFTIPPLDAPVTQTILNSRAATPGPLTVQAVARGSYARTVTWDLNKTVAGVSSKTFSAAAGAAAGPVPWEVTATKTAQQLNHRVSGEAVVSNGNAAAVDALVAAVLDNVTPATVDCNPVLPGDQTAVTVPAGGSVTCMFTASGAGRTSVTVTAAPSSPGVGGGTSTAGIAYAPDGEVDESVAVDDALAPADVLPAAVDTTTTWAYTTSPTCSASSGDYTDGALSFDQVNTAVATVGGEEVDRATATAVVQCSLTTVPPTRGLTLEKTVTPSGSVAPGAVLSYRLVVTGTGNSGSTGVVVTDHVPGTDPARPVSGATTYVAGSAECPAPCTTAFDAATGRVSWDIGALAAGQSVPVTFQVTVDAPGVGAPARDVLNAGRATSATHAVDSNLVTTPVVLVGGPPPPPPPPPPPLPPVHGLSLAKSVSIGAPAVVVGDVLTYQLVVTATGDQAEQDVVVTDVVPGRDPLRPGSGSTTYVPGTARCTGAGTCETSYDASTGTVSWRLGALTPSDDGRAVSFQVRVDAPPDADDPVADILNAGAADASNTTPVTSNVRTPVVGVQPEILDPVTTLAPVEEPPRTHEEPVLAPEPARPPAPPASPPPSLPFTGAGLLPLMTSGVLLFLLGALVVGASRRREQPE